MRILGLAGIAWSLLLSASAFSQTDSLKTGDHWLIFPGECELLKDTSESMQCTTNGILNFVQFNTIWPDTIPESEKLNGTRIMIEITTDINGVISETEIIRSAHPVLDSVVIEAIYKLPKLIPAIKNGQLVQTKFIIPCNIELK